MSPGQLLRRHLILAWPGNQDWVGHNKVAASWLLWQLGCLRPPPPTDFAYFELWPKQYLEYIYIAVCRSCRRAMLLRQEVKSIDRMSWQKYESA